MTKKGRSDLPLGRILDPWSQIVGAGEGDQQLVLGDTQGGQRVLRLLPLGSRSNRGRLVGDCQWHCCIRGQSRLPASFSR